MSDIRVRSSSFQSEDRSWLLGPAGTGPGENPSIALDVEKFTAATHYPDGFIPSGTVLGIVTASGQYGPYDAGADDGREKAAALLFSSLTVPAGASVLAGAGLHRGDVDPARLPFQTGAGALDDTARAHLYLVRFSDKPTVLETGTEV